MRPPCRRPCTIRRVRKYPARLVVLALVIAAGLGFGVAGLSQLDAVSVADPRPSIPPAVTLTPLPTAPAPTAIPTATASPTAEEQLWLYTMVEGDSISGVAVLFGTTTEEILTLNPEYEDNEDLVEAGAQLIMPCTPIAATEDRC